MLNTVHLVFLKRQQLKGLERLEEGRGGEPWHYESKVWTLKLSLEERRSEERRVGKECVG